jgi:preprotein translocase subunit Sss1
MLFIGLGLLVVGLIGFAIVCVAESHVMLER